MERTAASERTRRQVTKRVAFSPEPSGISNLKKVAPESKVSSKNNKKKSNTTEKKAPLPRKSLPASFNASKPTNDVFNKSAIESSIAIINQKPTPERKGGRLKLKTFAEIPSSSNGTKVNEDVAEEREVPKEQVSKAPKASRKSVPDVIRPRKGLLALKRYVPPPDDEEISEKPQSSQASSSTFSPNKYIKPTAEEKEVDLCVADPVNIPSIAEESQIINAVPTVTEVEKDAFKEIENDVVMVDEKDDSLTEKNETQINEVKNTDIQTENIITPSINNAETVAENNIIIAEETKNENTVFEKPKKISKKVSPLKISLSKHRPSLPAIPSRSPPATIERPSFSGRTRKPARSKEYPGHEDTLPSSSSAHRKRSKIPKAFMPPVSVPSTPAPMTPIQELMNIMERAGDLKYHRGGPPHGYMNPLQLPPPPGYMNSLQLPPPPIPPIPPPMLSPPLPTVSTDLPAHLAAYLPDRPHRSKSKNIMDFAPSLVSKDIKRKSLTGTVDEKLRSPSSSQSTTYTSVVEPMVIDDVCLDESITVEEEDINISGNFEIEDDTIFEDQIQYLKSLHPHLQKSFEALEENYEDEYFLREILTRDIINSEQIIPDEEELDVDGTESVKSLNYNLTFSAMKYANSFIKMFPHIDRVSLDEIPQHIETFLKERDATGINLMVFYEIIQKQCCMERAVKKHVNPLASYYLYSLQNATLLRSKIFVHFSYELVKAHEWLIRHLEEDVLASYLMILKFLQAAGTTLGNILITSANPTDATNITVNEHIRDMLEEKIRDPFSRMLTHLDRKLTNHSTFLMLISPGIKLQNEMTNAVYHAHEQLFGGLTNMGCTIEKIIIKDDDDLSEDFTVINACDFAVNFIKNKIVDAVKRRPNERIFIASWGVTCLFVHEAVIDVDGVSGIIDLAMPIKSKIGSRGKIGDKILLTYCPTMVVSGEDSGDVPDTAEMLNNFHISTGLCVVGNADSSLIVEPSLLAKYGITQACISRIILNHVMDFIERVVKDTHNNIHTKKLEVDYPYIITEDLNDHVMRDDTAYGVEETFLDDEEDPSTKPKELIVLNQSPESGEPVPEEEDDDFDSSSEIIKTELEPLAMKPEYPDVVKSEFVENVKSEIVEHPQAYGYDPSPYPIDYLQPMIINAVPEAGDVLNEFLDNNINYETMEVIPEGPPEEVYDEEMEFEEQMAAEAIEGGYTGEQNGYE
uniref:Uncharacterized protein n=1 Tax=Panagrolaimus sp. ES5 TaxID=591445 RepID=A0AC34GQK5_9BILA